MNNFKQVSSHKMSLTFGKIERFLLSGGAEHGGGGLFTEILCAMGNDHMGTFHPSP